MLETTERVRLLHAGDLRAVRRVLDSDPVTNVFVDARVEAAGSDLRRMGGQLWGFAHRGRLVSLCYSGANLVPVAATSAAATAFAERALRVGRHCSSVWGPRDAVAALWEVLEPSWGAARGIRADQPFLTLRREPAVRPDPFVRRVTMADLPLVYDASVAFFREELGVSPEARDGGAYYRSRVAELVRQRRAFARIEDGKVVFKAEIGATTAQACQIQGVWVAPEFRGRGHSETGMAAVLRYALADVAPIVSLYVNDYNTPARKAYRRIGFRETGAFMSVLF
jgi:uncharacterized protein